MMPFTPTEKHKYLWPGKVQQRNGKCSETTTYQVIRLRGCVEAIPKHATMFRTMRWFPERLYRIPKYFCDTHHGSLIIMRQKSFYGHVGRVKVEHDLLQITEYQYVKIYYDIECFGASVNMLLYYVQSTAILTSCDQCFVNCQTLL